MNASAAGDGRLAVAEVGLDLERPLALGGGDGRELLLGQGERDVDRADLVDDHERVRVVGARPGCRR